MQSILVDTWSNYKALISSKTLMIQYEESSTDYKLYAPEAGSFLWSITLNKDSGSDVADFETNFKPNANKPLEVKAGSGRPDRVCISPQPLGTYWHTKGYVLECGANDSSASLDIGFSAKIYLLGGHAISPDVVPGDKFKGEVQMQIAGNWTTILSPIEDVYLIPNIKADVVSDECMEFPTIYRLKITFTPASTGTAKKLYVRLEYFQ